MLRRDLAAVSSKVCSKKHLQKDSIFKSTMNYLTCWKLSVLCDSTFGSPHPKRYPCDCSPIWYLIIQKVQFFFFFLRKLIFESHFHQAQTFRFLPAQLWILNDWQNLGKFRKLWPWSEGTNSEIRSLRQTPPLCTSNHPAHHLPNDTTALENLLIHNTPHLHLRELVIRTTTSCRSSQKNLNIEVILCVWTNQSHTSAEGSFSFPGF